MRALDGRALASFRRRAAAFLIDLFIGAVLFMLVMVTVVGLAAAVRGGGDLRVTTSLDRSGRAGGDVLDLQLKFFSNWYSVIWWVGYFGLTTYLGQGRTPGKRLLRIRVVSLGSDRLSLWHAFERALGYGASALEFGFGFAQYFIHPNRQTVHDRIAETIVVLDARPTSG